MDLDLFLVAHPTLITNSYVVYTFI